MADYTIQQLQPAKNGHHFEMTGLKLGPRGAKGRSEIGVVTKRALVIDHEPVIRNLIANLLAIKEIESDQAATHDEAIQMLGDVRYDLIIVDLMLPRENGFLMLDQIRTQWPDRMPHTVLTTNGDPKFLERVSRDGWCAILIKPFAMSEFFRIVESCLGNDAPSELCYN